MVDSGDEARLYIQVGDNEISLNGTMREVNDDWTSAKDQEDWKSALEKIRLARDESESRYANLKSNRGRHLARLIDHCGIHRTTDLILAAVYYLRVVEKEDDTPPRVLKQLLSSTGKWTEDDIEKWNISLYINRMIEGGTGDEKRPLLAYPSGTDKNRHVVLTKTGVEHLERLSS
ncbi:MAG: hypothetical protein CMB42_01220 [Euryarchaeota archaeon]|nr:hypothetical protein [Euryarchaeota archaeon]|tara:strand:- start:43857 stop:44381 length:525 start_codon:yes stop_codon:yes gene_type:complete